MKIKNLLIMILIIGCLSVVCMAQNQNGCSGGKRNGIFYTDCWADTGDDTSRLQSAVTAAYGKLIFNEANYSITGELLLHGQTIIEGTGMATSIITQNTANKSVFRIPHSEQEIAIRDISLKGNASGTMGILAQGGGTGETGSSLFFQFSNIRFLDFDKGIYVNAVNSGSWQFDNVRLDRCTFGGNTTGVHINSFNSGWAITAVDMDVPHNGVGFYFERSTYTSVDQVIGNGPALGSGYAGEAFIKIVRHANISIRNAASEGFVKDLVIDGVNTSTRSFPIALINNHFLHGISVKDSTVVSTGNQFGNYDGSTNYIAEVTATGDSVIYSYGDKFCYEGQSCIKSGVNYNGYVTSGNAKVVTSIGGVRNTISLGREGYWFDIGRSETDGSLTFTSGTTGFGYTFDANYGATNMKNTVLNFTNGTITLGSSTYANLAYGITDNGTLYYCSDCKANAGTGACEGSGSGAIAKRLAGAWKCN